MSGVSCHIGLRKKPADLDQPCRPLALTDNQMAELRTVIERVPYKHRREFLERVAEQLRGRDFGDGDVHRAAVAAAREITAREPRGTNVLDGVR